MKRAASYTTVVFVAFAATSGLMGCGEKSSQTETDSAGSGGQCNVLFSRMRATTDKIVGICKGSTGDDGVGKATGVVAKTRVAIDTVKNVSKGTISPQALKDAPVNLGFALFDTACEGLKVVTAVGDISDSKCNQAAFDDAMRKGLTKVGGSVAHNCAEFSSLIKSEASKLMSVCTNANISTVKSLLSAAWNLRGTLVYGAAPFWVAVSAVDSTCKAAAATSAFVEYSRSKCSEREAIKFNYQTTADLCGHLNDVNEARGNVVFPDWCPDRKAKKYYCYAKDISRGASCYVFGKNLLGKLMGADYKVYPGKEFIANPAGGLTLSGGLFQGVQWRKSSVQGRECFVMDRDVTCGT